jgi:hypothetical protein
MGATKSASQSGQARYSGDLAISIDERTVKHVKTDVTRHFRADRSSPPSLYLKQRFQFLNIVIFESMKLRKRRSSSKESRSALSEGLVAFMTLNAVPGIGLA